VSPTGGIVYAGDFLLGNQTTAIGKVWSATASTSPHLHSTRRASVPGGVLPPSTDHLNNQAPEVGIIVKYNQALARWRRARPRLSQLVRFSLPTR
jgi:hypothetical protein